MSGARRFIGTINSERPSFFDCRERRQATRKRFIRND